MDCRSYIGGQWSGERDAPVVELGNPADRRAIVSRCVHATVAEAICAAEAAVSAGPYWRRVPAEERIRLLEQASAAILESREEFACALSNETGKTLVEAHQEIDATMVETRTQVALFRNGMRVEINEHHIIYEPLGAVLLVTPSNFPLAAVMRKLVPALLAGNTVVVKASELTPLTATLLFTILNGVGFAPGVVNLVIADGRTVVSAMIATPGLRAVSLTGSNASGSAILKVIGERRIRFQAEMGGSNVVVVLADADLEMAASGVVGHGFACCGQWCTGTTRVIVEAAIHDDFLALVSEGVGKITVGPGSDPATDMGPLISQMQRQCVEDTVNSLLAAGARAVCGGRRPSDKNLVHGNYFEPTVLADIADYESLGDQEIFGPVVAVVKAGSVDDALTKANTGRFGLSFSIYTRDHAVAERFVAEADAGLCHINLPTGFRDNALPLFGRKDSGRGIPECGIFARDFYTQTKAVYG